MSAAVLLLPGEILTRATLEWADRPDLHPAHTGLCAAPGSAAQPARCSWPSSPLTALHVCIGHTFHCSGLGKCIQL